MPEVWHYITAAQIVPGVVVPPEQAPSPRGYWEDQGCAPSAHPLVKLSLKRLSRAPALGRLLLGMLCIPEKGFLRKVHSISRTARVSMLMHGQCGYVWTVCNEPHIAQVSAGQLLQVHHTCIFSVSTCTTLSPVHRLAVAEHARPPSCRGPTWSWPKCTPPVPAMHCAPMGSWSSGLYRICGLHEVL